MILKGSQRGGATQLATHLLRTDENDHVELHEVSGFVADDVRGAFREAFAVSRGTKFKQFLFSLSLSPPPSETVPVTVFEQAIVTIEAKLGLTGQPRVIVFHGKQGRRHAHCVWSRIDAEAMKAINLSHFKLKLRDVARDLFFEHGWLMPPGLANSAERDARNFTREEWQQAKRADQDAGDLKGIFHECWAMSDSGKAFAQALGSRGLYLARGDRRGFVAIDVKGEVYSIPKWTGLKSSRSNPVSAIRRRCAASTKPRPISPTCCWGCWDAIWPMPNSSIKWNENRSSRPSRRCAPTSGSDDPFCWIDKPSAPKTKPGIGRGGSDPDCAASGTV